MALMLLLVTSDAVPARTFLALRASAPAPACSCCGECSCPSCDSHHPNAPEPGPGLFAASCGGCSTGGGSGVPLPAVTVYEVPDAELSAPRPRLARPIVADASVPPAWPARTIDPPPRPAAA
ncbi:MAG: hypothetical protein IT348_19620 [Candidatus Eisenbacteria bacterium]|nr:hypothetical protein [Candidatus Eisenbacteria bacterium]